MILEFSPKLQLFNKRMNYKYVDINIISKTHQCKIPNTRVNVLN